MNSETSEVEYIKVENNLVKKTGTGGLPAHVIEAATKKAEAIEIDYMPFVIERIESLSKQLKGDDYINTQSDETIENFLFDLVPIDVNLKLARDKTLSAVATLLLKFVEKLTYVNVDGFQVMRAHVNTMEVMLAKDIKNPQDPVFNALIAELQKACDRYHMKYKEHDDTIGDVVQ